MLWGPTPLLLRTPAFGLLPAPLLAPPPSACPSLTSGHFDIAATTAGCIAPPVRLCSARLSRASCRCSPVSPGTQSQDTSSYRTTRVV